MSIALFFLVALGAAAVIVLPLLPGWAGAQSAVAATDEDIEQAVRWLRRSRSKDSRSCQVCGSPFRQGDRFCVSCGASLPGAALAARICPVCGAGLREADQFCGKCGTEVAQSSKGAE